jgi:flagellar biosynthesis anti-sigma factor FlgM
MKINPVSNQTAINAYKTPRLASPVNELTPAADQVSLSKEALALSSTISKLKEMIDIRSPQELARIEEIAKQIHNGSYQMDSEKVAAKIVDEYLDLFK